MGSNALFVRGDAVFACAPGFDAALNALADATRCLGFDIVDYGFMPRAREADGRYHAPTIIARNLSRRWQRGWSRFLRDDPLLHGAYPRTLPLHWAEIQQASWLTPIQHEAFRFIGELGINDGVTVPIHLPDNAFAFVTAASSLANSAWRAKKARVLEKLFVLAHAFHANHGGRMSVVPQLSQRSLLTPREQLVLRYAAAGLTAPETATRIHRSVETVRLQRKSAMRKLDAHTIAQAVARALDRQLLVITPAG